MRRFRILEKKSRFTDKKVYYPQYEFYFLWILPFWVYYKSFYGRKCFLIFEEAEDFIDKQKKKQRIHIHKC